MWMILNDVLGPGTAYLENHKATRVKLQNILIDSGSIRRKAQSRPYPSAHRMSSGEGIERSLVAQGVTWDSFGLDPRLTRAVTKLGWLNPTLVQSAAIPRVLQGMFYNFVYSVDSNAAGVM